MDASQRGIGAVLLQANGPVEFASKLLSKVESRYSNIEREMLPVLFGLEKFHYFAYGRPVVMESDHKPVEAIFKKRLTSAPPRLARMLLRIQKLQIKYLPGKDIPVADALSRISSYPGEAVQWLDNLSTKYIFTSMLAQQGCSRFRKKLLKIQPCQPCVMSSCPAALLAYRNYRDELTVADGLILKDTRIIITESLQPAVLKQLHYAHKGAETCQLRVKGSVFWAH